MPTMPMRTDPYARTPAKLSKTGKTFMFVLALHVGLVWLAQAVWTNKSAVLAPALVAAQLIQEFQAPKPPDVPKPEPIPVPTAKTLPAREALPTVPSPLPAPVSPVPHALPAITAAPVVAPPPTAPVAPAPAVLAVPAAVKPAPAPVTVAASARMDSCAKPRYPAASERLGEQGVVSLKFLISENGQVLSGSVDQSSGYKRLDDAALAAISLCKFRPATVDGKPRQEWSALRYRWELNN